MGFYSMYHNFFFSKLNAFRNLRATLVSTPNHLPLSSKVSFLDPQTYTINEVTYTTLNTVVGTIHIKSKLNFDKL